MDMGGWGKDWVGLTAVQLLLSGTPGAIWRQSRGQADFWELHQYSVVDVRINFGIWTKGISGSNKYWIMTYDAC